jgi:hypothetical protein
MPMSASLEHKGGKYYHSADHEGALNMSKASLGKFVNGILKHGGEILTLWPFNRHYNRSWVGAVVAMTPDAKEAFEKETGFKLNDPPTISLN